MVNKKTIWSVCNIGLRLLIICLAVAALTALVYAVTEKSIAEGERARKEDAIRLIFADAADFAEDPTVVGEGVNAAYAVTDAAGVSLGWCVDYTGNSQYGGDVSMMIGVTPNGKVNGVQVIGHAETFIDRYLDEKKRYTGIDQPRGGDLSAGATMSYEAIRNAMEAVENIFRMRTADAGERGETVLFGEADIQLLFADAADFSESLAVDMERVNGVCVVRNAAREVLGHCVHYTAKGYRDGNEMLLAVDAQGQVNGVLLLRCGDTLMHTYLDEHGCYTGVAEPRYADAVAGSTQSYTAIRTAMETVEAMRLGGAL